MKRYDYETTAYGFDIIDRHDRQFKAFSKQRSAAETICKALNDCEAARQEVVRMCAAARAA
jgi:hypothetical protein